eukprot:499566-Hanusia_phi.AAC.5
MQEDEEEGEGILAGRDSPGKEEDAQEGQEARSDRCRRNLNVLFHLVALVLLDAQMLVASIQNIQQQQRSGEGRAYCSKEPNPRERQPLPSLEGCPVHVKVQEKGGDESKEDLRPEPPRRVQCHKLVSLEKDLPWWLSQPAPAPALGHARNGSNPIRRRNFAARTTSRVELLLYVLENLVPAHLQRTSNHHHDWEQQGPVWSMFSS